MPSRISGEGEATRTGKGAGGRRLQATAGELVQAGNTGSRAGQGRLCSALCALAATLGHQMKLMILSFDLFNIFIYTLTFALLHLRNFAISHFRTFRPQS
jgi:hypothetical protein